MDAGSIVILLMAYLLIGGVTGASIDMHDSSIMCASFIFWPMIILIYACRGFIMIIRGER